MAHVEPSSIGRQYNTILAQEESAYAIHLGTQHGVSIARKGFTPVDLERLVNIGQSLETLDFHAVKLEKAKEQATDRVEQLIKRSVTEVGDVCHLAESSPVLVSSGALASLPSRSQSKSVTNQAKALLECSAFVLQYQAEFQAANAPEDLAQRLEALANELTAANKLQEVAIQKSLEANNALFVARGEVYLIAKRLYRVGRFHFRSQPSIAGAFKFQSMKAKTSSSSKSTTEQAAQKLKGKSTQASAPAKTAKSAKDLGAKKSPEPAKVSEPGKVSSPVKALPSVEASAAPPAPVSAQASTSTSGPALPIPSVAQGQPSASV